MNRKEVERQLIKQRSLCYSGFKWYKKQGIEPVMAWIWKAIVDGCDDHVMWLFKQPEYNRLRKEITIRWALENDLNIFNWSKLMEVLTVNKDYFWVLRNIMKQYGNVFGGLNG